MSSSAAAVIVGIGIVPVVEPLPAAGAAPDQPPGQPCAEVAMAADDEDAAQSTRFACSGRGNQQVARRPNRR